MRRILVIAFLILALLSCSEGGKKRLLNNPSAVVSLADVLTCTDGERSFVAFVLDEGKEGKGRIKKINGCSGIDKSFTDGKDKDDHGLLVGPSAAGLAVARSKTGYSLATLNQGEGTLMFKDLDETFEYSGDRDIDISGRPLLLQSAGEGFVVETISESGEVAILKLDVTGELKGDLSLDVPFDTIFSSGDFLYGFNKYAGRLFRMNHDLQGSVEELSGYEGLSALFDLGDGRLLGTGRNGDNERYFFIMKGDKEVLGRTPLQDTFSLVSAAAVRYPSDDVYGILEKNRYFEKVELELPEEESDDYSFPSTGDVDLSDSEKSDEDISDGTTEESVSEGEVSDTEIEDEDDLDGESVDADQDEVKPEDEDIIMLATAGGRVFAYSLTRGGWLITEDSSDKPVLERVVRQGGEEGAPVPRIEKISVIRGLAHTVDYDFTYERVVDESISSSGRFGETHGIFLDDAADYSRFGVEPGVDALFIYDSDNPACEGVSIAIEGVISGNSLKTEKTPPECEGFLSYGIYPVEHYLVRRNDYFGSVRYGRASERSFDDSSAAPSYDDSYMNITLKGKQGTVPGYRIRIRVEQGVRFRGYDTTMPVTRMYGMRNGEVLIFSNIFRALYRIDLGKEVIAETYE